MTDLSPDDEFPSKWYNALPNSILYSPAYRKLRQPLRHTLQVMCNRCTKLEKGEPDTAPRLVCFGGFNLAKKCGCDRKTLGRHISILERLGFVVPLTSGGGRLATIYGIPGVPGQLDPFRADPDDRARAWRVPEDNDEIRALVRQNAPLAEANGKQMVTKWLPNGNRDELSPLHGQNAAPLGQNAPLGSGQNAPLSSPLLSPVSAPLPNPCCVFPKNPCEKASGEGPGQTGVFKTLLKHGCAGHKALFRSDKLFALGWTGPAIDAWFADHPGAHGGSFLAADNTSPELIAHYQRLAQARECAA